MKIRFVAGKAPGTHGRPYARHDFPELTKNVLRGFVARSDDAFMEVMGAPPPIVDVHAMTPAEVRRDEAIGGGDGYMHIDRTGRIRVAIRPDVDPYRACEVWVEEQVHALAPELSEHVVRTQYVPEITRKILNGS